MKFGISGQVLSEAKSLEEILTILKSYNVSNMEIWPENIPSLDGTKINNNVYEGRNIQKAKDILKQYGMNVACVTMSAAFDKEIVSDIKRYAASLRYAVEVAEELGCQFVNHYCYHICLEETPNTDIIIRYMESAIELAESKGIILCLENEAHDATRNPEGVYSIIKAANSKCFKTNFDATNYYHAGGEAFPHAYNLLKEHIAYVHIKNGCIYSPNSGHSEKSKGGPMTGKLAPNYIYYPYLSEGAVNMDGLLLTLQRDGYNGYCVLEPHTVAENAENYFKNEIQYLIDRGFIQQSNK